ncbi:hypothetical protein ABW19_dt0207030 [Dactylella cylindrospora]|nr:hypothetical protein ABW19_dt0207030 [Dactylella cylindrospora]
MEVESENIHNPPLVFIPGGDMLENPIKYPDVIRNSLRTESFDYRKAAVYDGRGSDESDHDIYSVVTSIQDAPFEHEEPFEHEDVPESSETDLGDLVEETMRRGIREEFQLVLMNYGDPTLALSDGRQLLRVNVRNPLSGKTERFAQESSNLPEGLTVEDMVGDSAVEASVINQALGESQSSQVEFNFAYGQDTNSLIVMGPDPDELSPNSLDSDWGLAMITAFRTKFWEREEADGEPSSNQKSKAIPSTIFIMHPGLESRRVIAEIYQENKRPNDRFDPVARSPQNLRDYWKSQNHRDLQDWYLILGLKEVIAILRSLAPDQSLRTKAFWEITKVELWGSSDNPIIKVTIEEVSQDGRSFIQRWGWQLTHACNLEISGHDRFLLDQAMGTGQRMLWGRRLINRQQKPIAPALIPEKYGLTRKEIVRDENFPPDYLGILRANELLAADDDLSDMKMRTVEIHSNVEPRAPVLYYASPLGSWGIKGGIGSVTVFGDLDKFADLDWESRISLLADAYWLYHGDRMNRGDNRRPEDIVIFGRVLPETSMVFREAHKIGGRGVGLQQASQGIWYEKLGNPLTGILCKEWALISGTFELGAIQRAFRKYPSTRDIVSAHIFHYEGGASLMVTIGPKPNTNSNHKLPLRQCWQ